MRLINRTDRERTLMVDGNSYTFPPAKPVNVRRFEDGTALLALYPHFLADYDRAAADYLEKLEKVAPEEALKPFKPSMLQDIAGEPSETWKKDDLLAYARRMGLKVSDAQTKKDLLAVIAVGRGFDDDPTLPTPTFVDEKGRGFTPSPEERELAEATASSVRGGARANEPS